jgi:threonine/homoserine/homoserine lactone efflux protein
MEVLEYVVYSFATCLFIFIVPGPIFFLSISEGVRGIRAGLLMMLGATTAQSMLLLILATGLLLLLRQVIPELSLIGAALLVLIGASAIRTALRGHPGNVRFKAGGSFARGFAMTLVNPAFILWLLTVGATVLELGLTTVGTVAYAIFSLDILVSSAGMSLLLILLSSRGRRLTGERGMRVLTLISGLAFLAIAFALTAPLLL